MVLSRCDPLLVQKQGRVTGIDAFHAERRLERQQPIEAYHGGGAQQLLSERFTRGTMLTCVPGVKQTRGGGSQFNS